LEQTILTKIEPTISSSFFIADFEVNVGVACNTPILGCHKELENEYV